MKTYNCAYCGAKQKRISSEEEMRKELKETFGDIDPSECSIVCDECWQVMMNTPLKDHLCKT